MHLGLCLIHLSEQCLADASLPDGKVDLELSSPGTEEHNLAVGDDSETSRERDVICRCFSLYMSMYLLGSLALLEGLVGPQLRQGCNSTSTDRGQGCHYSGCHKVVPRFATIATPIYPI